MRDGQVPPEPSGADHWVVDGNNVVGSRPDGWWRDRKAASRRLVDALGRHGWPKGSTVLVVFDGPAPADSSGAPEESASSVSVAYSGPGRSADDRIVDEVARRKGPSVVVTSDRGLRARVEELGAAVVPSGTLLRRLDQKS